MTLHKAVVNTDIFVEHLAGVGQPSFLRMIMSHSLCYATVFQASQLMALCSSRDEHAVVKDLLGAVKLLGVNARSAIVFGRLLRQLPEMDPLTVLTAGMCLEARLPILTRRGKDFEGVKGLRVLTPSSFKNVGTPSRVERSV